MPSDSLMVFAAMWGMAMLFSSVSHTPFLLGLKGVKHQILEIAIILNALYVMWKPSRLATLLSLAALLCIAYASRMPVSSNNQTIATYMNLAIVAVIGPQLLLRNDRKNSEALIYERLRFVAKSLLAIMYFFGIFHKINTDFLDPAVSCATALYVPLTREFGLDDSLVGRYLAIYSTFVIEAIAIACLYIRRLFWLGLLISLPFHYVIPISGYSYYMDFSSLVFALYMLSMPRQSALVLYADISQVARKVVQLRAGAATFALLVAALLIGTATVTWLSYSFVDRPFRILWHSAWLVAWAVLGGIAMIFILRAALASTANWQFARTEKRPWWLYLFPVVLFVSCWSPYVGLKTESSIAMFSNLHTEGGVTNHMMFGSPPYLFSYQAKVARIAETSNPKLLPQGNNGDFLTEHDLALRILGNPKDWFTYVIDGKVYSGVTAATYTGYRPNFIERKLLDFKPIDWTRPKPCTH
ncbi:thiol-disulfide oxidoreductase [Sphingomonas sp. 37zxx]|uniref:thiol-disulfide oxidoreductase n=1 Tax=Sphingomonas sp. 37zxx TaxID=1550073 RepID=UPI0012E0AD2B|nr:thiol-disulfide oxidoreductase [Sphingomonas sp. 37zxx]